MEMKMLASVFHIPKREGLTLTHWNKLTPINIGAMKSQHKTKNLGGLCPVMSFTFLARRAPPYNQHKASISKNARNMSETIAV